MFGCEYGFHTANVYSSRPQRRIFICQKRFTEDYAVPARLLAALGYKRVEADYYLVAETKGSDHPVKIESTLSNSVVFPDEVGCLVGQISIVRPQASKEREAARINAFKKLKHLAETHHQLDQKGQELQPETDVFHQFEVWLDILIQAGTPVDRFQFVVFRTGEVRIAPIDKDLSAKKFEDGATNSRDDYISNTASQAYYFIKDCAHRHYHHRGRQDNILPLSRTNPFNDEGWRRETMWSLVRALLRERRGHSTASFARANGILAYASAFQKHLGGHKRSGRCLHEFRPITAVTEYDLQYMASSISSRRDELSEKRAQLRENINFAVATLIALAALWLTVDGNATNPAASGGILGSTLGWFAASPNIGFVAVFALWFVYLRISQGRVPIWRWVHGLLHAVESVFFDLARWLVKKIGPSGDGWAAAFESLFWALATGFLTLGFFSLVAPEALETAKTTLLNIGSYLSGLLGNLSNSQP